MQAGETKLQPMLEGTKQYLVPLFQRPYSWDAKEWKILWADLADLCEVDDPRPHFMGSIVTMPTVSVPEGVSKYLLIDGQQRLTTIFVLLALLRDLAKSNNQPHLAEEINNTLLVNPYKTGHDRFKLQPTQADRDAFRAIIDSTALPERTTQVFAAYKFFEREMRKKPLDIERLKIVISKTLSAVSIVLDINDNPHLVFEGLNAKGRPLTQADLIRNYFVMRVHVDAQEDVYRKSWRPMQESLGDSLTEFIRHYLIMQLGDTVNVNDVYFVLKDQITPANAVPYLEDLAKHAVFYERFLFPDHEPNELLRAALWRIRRMEVGVSYPFLLRCYAQHAAGQLSLDEFIEILKVIENFLIRRFVCNVPTYGLNKVFPPLFTQIQRAKSKTVCDGLKAVLQAKNYPKDYDFRSKLRDAKLYGPGDRITKTKLILEALESAYEHKEQVPYDKLTIEHVMPQTLSDNWKAQLGSDWQMVHELYLHTLGNLTLTAYNSELSNEPYPTKRKLLQESHIELNRTFGDYETWTTQSIDDRATALSEMALAVWPYFGADPDGSTGSGNVVGKSPKALWILGQRYDVSSWRDVLEFTVDTIADLEPDGFERILEEFPRFVGRDKNKFRSVRELKCGAFVEVNLGAEAIYRFCCQAIEVLGLSSDEWSVEAA
jgi:uncharacterized protein with ParB-like and HNH nuclease domain